MIDTAAISLPHDEEGRLPPWRFAAPLHAALVLPALVFLSPALFFGGALYRRDTGLYFYPHKLLAAQALRAGRLPQWNPFEYGGTPFLADPNYNVFHPLSLLTDLLPMPWGFQLFVLACALCAAYGAAALGRELGLSARGSAIAGLAYAWSGPFVSLLESGQLVAPSFLPWLCAAGVALARRPSRATFALAAVAAALVLLSGTPEIGACAFLLGGALCLAAGGPRPFLLFVLAAGFGAALAAAQLFPTLAMLRQSSRAEGFAFAQATAMALHPLRLPGFVFPFFSGAPDAPGTPSWLLDPGRDPPYVDALYLGLLPLLLAAAGLGRSERRRLVAVLLAISALLLLPALGDHTPLYRWLWSALPPLRAIRFPEKLVVPFALAVAVAAGAGWDRLGQGPALAPRRATLWLAAGAAVLATAAWMVRGAVGALLPPPQAACFAATAGTTVPRELFLAALLLTTAYLWQLGRLGGRAAGLCAAVLLAADLGLPAFELSGTVPAAALVAPSPLAERIRLDAGVPLTAFRVEVRSSGLSDADLLPALGGEGRRSEQLFLLRRFALYDAGAVLAGLRLSTGYSGFTLRAMQALHAAGPTALDRLGIRYAVDLGHGGASSPFARMGYERVTSAFSGLVTLWRNPRAAPSLRLVGPPLVGRAGDPPPDCDAVWLTAPDAAALPPELRPIDGCGSKPPSQPGRAEIDRYEPERVVARVETAAPGLLVLSDAWAPGWSVEVDGAPAPPLRADGALRAVAVPAGTHEVAWRYRAPGLLAGGAVSLLSLAGLCMLALSRRTARA